MIHEVDLEFDIIVEDGSVHVSVSIGDGQIGGSSMKLDGEAVGPVGEISNFRVGEASDLVGRKLAIRTLVADMSDRHNWTSVTYQLKTPTRLPPIKAKKEVENDQEAVRYNTTFIFVREKTS